MITKELIEEILTSVENGKRQKEQERTLEINNACSESDLFIQLCIEIFNHGINREANIINTLAVGVIAGIDIGLKIAKKEQESCLMNPSQTN